MACKWRHLGCNPAVLVAGITVVLMLVKLCLPGGGAADGPVPLVGDELVNPAQEEVKVKRQVAPPGDGRAGQTQLVNVAPSTVTDCVSGYQDVQSSGLASSRYHTRPTVRILDSVFTFLRHTLKLHRLRILDLPCGDMVWMNDFLRNRTDVEHYTGLDIVPELITKHRVRYADQPNWRFAVHDVVKEPYAGRFDLVICRLLTQHLTNADTLRALQNLATGGGARFLLITDYGYVGKKNADIIDWSQLDRYRRQNLQVEPFHLQPPICSSRDSQVAGWLSLWRLPLYAVERCRGGGPVRKTRRNGQQFFHCA